MKNSLKYYGFLIVALASFNFSGAQNVIVSQDFEDPALMDWTLNEVIQYLGTSQSDVNVFVVNDTYQGGIAPNFLIIPDTDNQDIQITNFPNSNYLHTTISPELGLNIFNCNYVNSGGEVPQSLISLETPDYSTIGYEGVDVSFWWLAGGSNTDFGTEVYYSINQGLTWDLIAGPLTGQSWIEENIDMNNQIDDLPNVRFAFVFNNDLGNVDEFVSGFAVDDFKLLADCVEDLGPDFTVCTGELVTIVADTASYDSFSWSTNVDSIGGTLNVLVDKDTTITVTSTSTGICDVTDEITITVDPIRPVLNVTVLSNLNGVDIQCDGQCNGEVSVEVIGGVSEDETYEVSWFDADMNPVNEDDVSNSAGLNFTSILNNACSDTYFVSVLDDICSTPENSSVTLTSNTEITNNFVGDSVSCFNGRDGSITANPSGGIPPYSYDWGTYGTGQTISGLPIGTYTVVITDNAGCPMAFSYEIEQPNELIVNASVTSEISCYDASDGELSATVFGGTSAYSYVWSHPDFLLVDDPANNTQSLDNLPSSVGAEDFAQNPDYQSYSDPYLLTVTDNRGCVQTSEIYLIEPPKLNIFLTQETLPAYCENSTIGFNTGFAEVSANGGTPNDDNTYISFVWSLAGETETNVLYSSIESVHAGTYSVTATDKRGCVDNTIFEIDLIPTWTAYTSFVDASCFGYNDGEVSIQMEGGCGDPENSCNFSYQWQGGSATGNVLPDAVGLQPGTYYVTVTDDFGCEGVYDVAVGSPDRVDFELTDREHQSCFTATSNSSDGSVDVSVVGGTSPYDVTWLNNSIAEGTVNTPADVVIEDLYDGMWQIEVVDSKGCEGIYKLNSLISNPFEIDEGIEVLADINQDILFLTETIECFGDANGKASVLNPNPSFDYTWHLAGNTTVLDEGNSTEVMPAGNIVVTASYLLGLCTADSDPVTIGQNTSFTITDASVAPSCYGDSDGQIIVAVNGATPFLNNDQISDYNFSWNPTSLDGQGVVTVDGELAFIIPGQSAGTYFLEVSDRYSCDTVFIIDFVQPDPITFTVTTNDLTCNELNAIADGKINTTPTGGTPPYNNNILNEANNLTGSTLLSAGLYNVSISDSKGCVSATSNVNIYEPNLLTVGTVTSSNVLCHYDSSGSIESVATGGTPSYTYEITDLSINSTGVFDNLPVDNYVLTVTDSKGCFSDSQNVEITEPDTLTVSISSFSDVTCNGYADGSINIDVNGGVQPYKFNWSDGSETEDLNNIPADFYIISLVDGNGCQDKASIIINELEEVVADWIIVSPGVITNNTIVAQASPFDVKFVDVSSYANSNLTQWWIDEENMTDSLYKNPSLEMIEFSFVEMGDHNVVMYAINNAGCFDTVSFNFTVQGLEEFDAFSPNGDNVNDYFYFRNHGLSELSASIFNRWGEKIYDMDSIDDKWDGISLNGQEVPTGVYFYIVDAKGADGTPYQSKGSVSLFR